ncbi:hypothetical protein [Nocardia lijiangensis]|uniref:hypothetical protein n=1 Tax=Nocardia lijiangensis TaxID=299618 RepID=UPI0008330913|nr:hypothetical protein [Nocardia lijiangensis]
MVLDEVWRRLDGVEALSGPHGGPLRRTVKLVLDPLVIRPVQHPTCAGAILSADGATLLATRIFAAADVLRATAAWFTLLKQVRRALRITEGNPQDLYFQRCFELATTAGHPDPVRDRQTAEAALRDIHEFAAGRTTQALKNHLTDAGLARELGGLIEIAWRRRPATASGDHTAAFEELLDACANSRVTGDGQPELDRLVAARAGTHSGIDLWHRASGGSANELGLTAHPLPHPPALGASASKADLGLPFDRTIYERVFTVLQASSERAELPPIPELVTDEIARSCSPWALLDETLRVAAATGAVLAVGLSPFGAGVNERVHEAGRVRRLADAAWSERGSTDAKRVAGRVSAPVDVVRGSAANQVINNRWRREAYVLQARRLAVHDGDEVRGPLAQIAAELRTPWRPYLRRLWVRLHGRDVRTAPVAEPEELWDLLDGVARSVILDHRTKVKNALSANAVAGEGDSTESRAS